MMTGSSSASILLSAIPATAAGATDIGPDANSVEGHIKTAVDTGVTATTIATTASVNNVVVVTTATDSSSSDFFTSTDSNYIQFEHQLFLLDIRQPVHLPPQPLQSTSTSTSATSGLSSAMLTSTSTAQSTATADPNVLATLASHQLFTAIQITTAASNGQPTTIYTSVYAISTGTAESSTGPNTPVEAMFRAWDAISFWYLEEIFLSLILPLTIVLQIVQYHTNRKFERELNEQVDNEVQSGTPIFGFGKEDDEMSVRGIGMGAGAIKHPRLLSDQRITRPTPSGAPRCYPSPRPLLLGIPGLQLNPTNAFALATSTAPGTYANNKPNYNYNYGDYRSATSSPVLPANYGEYCGPSPAPSTQSYQSYGARPGTPTALTPGGAGRASLVPGVALLREACSGINIGVQHDSPVPGVGGPRRGSRDYVPSGLGRQPSQMLGLPASNLMRGNSVNSIKAPLLNPFDQKY
ncbi:hypothetical protein BT96DRAFT_1058758 [Gymnopus androsaceus JB14]|uniref:Uncharacterized protein n=1 Tax=Gymnopus androsaceus JB14 TaxID=1447944 RepID=A0A6A4H2Q3_9AGAR|nr:hypothetical protein BT96DRAFT_1058758 [Gymnopus androsaceus JB14]